MKYFILLFIIISSCSEKKAGQIAIPKYPNPEHTSMEGKRRVLVCGDSITVYDTLIFDDRGRRIEERNQFSHRRYAYDSNNFLTRARSSECIARNLLFKYEVRSDTIFQKVYDLNHFEWQYSEEDYNSQSPFYTNYFIVNSGLISLEDRGNTKYFYDDLNRLVRKVSSYGGRIRRNEIFEYTGSSLRLNKQIFLDQMDTTSISHYENGVFSSTERFSSSSPSYTIEYRQEDID